MVEFEIPYYLDFLPAEILQQLAIDSEQVDAIPGLQVANGLRAKFPRIETDEALRFVCELYDEVKTDLRELLDQRAVDRKFIDDQTLRLVKTNRNRDYQSGDYETVIGRRDEAGRIVIGPLEDVAERIQVDVPDFLQGWQVTLFGPPVSTKMAINAMNALKRKSPDEPTVVTELVEAGGQVPRWGADNEDSQTPIMENYLQACENLIGCFDQTLTFTDPDSERHYELDDDGLSIPIKRIPGLALPDGSHLYRGNPLPLHLFDFAMHLFHNFDRPRSLVFYIPKLENELEAAYFRKLLQVAEEKIVQLRPEYQAGQIRLFVVFENPRAIFRIREMANALHPYFAGGSLGWHDFLASTARVFRYDPNYRIPVKADPNIVINHIRQSHRILVDALEPLGAIRIGGMYGTLYEDGNEASYTASMVGYIKDVVTQLKRGLTGFWVAHPAFVRTGLALVEAFRRGQSDLEDDSLEQLIGTLVHDSVEQQSLLEFVRSEDAPGLDPGDPCYLRSVLAASMAESDVIANNDPEEVRYNVFQALQYLADWLSGNGCVALPASIKNIHQQDVFVRIMDDLATTERSRWELWAEVHHGRVAVNQFDEILSEQIDFIRTGEEEDSAGKQRIQVRWEGEAARWYPIAAKILRTLVISQQPVEFATELLLPFTFPAIRNAEDPWQIASELCPGKFL